MESGLVLQDGPMNFFSQKWPSSARNRQIRIQVQALTLPNYCRRSSGIAT